MKYTIQEAASLGVLAIAMPLAGTAAAQATRTFVVSNPPDGTHANPAQYSIAVAKADSDDDSGPPATGLASVSSQIVIRSIEPDGGNEPGREVAWLGLAVEESPDVLSSQLGLKPGEGLIVEFPAPDSPAAKAGFLKNDVLTELDGQMLLDPTQLRKLVQMHKEGDTIALTYFRGGQKQTAHVKLGKQAADRERGGPAGSFAGFRQQMGNLDSQMGAAYDALAAAGLDKDAIKLEIKRTLDQTSKAIHDSIQQAADAKSLTNLAQELENLAREGVSMDKDSTVTVSSKHNSSRTMVKTDDDGSMIYVSGDKEHLTVTDKDGKTTFDGDISTPEEKAKVPKEIFEKLQLMLKQNTFHGGGRGAMGGSGGGSGSGAGLGGTGGGSTSNSTN